MAKSTRRARLILVLIALAVVGFGVVAWKPLFNLIFTKTTFVEHPVGEKSPLYGFKIWHREYRWNEYPAHGVYEVWYILENGFKERELVRRGNELLSTYWHADGRVHHQLHLPDLERLGGGTRKNSPPWWWNMTDQTEPSAPWWKGEND